MEIYYTYKEKMVNKCNNIENNLDVTYCKIYRIERILNNRKSNLD